MEPPKLLDLAIKALVDNIDNFDKDLVKIIIVPVRQKMLKEMVESHRLKCDDQDNHLEKMWALLPVLINSKFYTKLSFLDMPRMCYRASSTVTNSRFQEFIRCLGANTPNLRELKICSPTDTTVYSLGERELNSIIQLKNLAILEIYNVHVPVSGIFGITRECEKLDRIEADKVRIDVELSCAAFGDDFSYIFIEAFYFYHGRMSLKMERTMPTWNPKYKDNTHYIHLKLWPKTNQELLLLAQRFAEKLKEIWIILEDYEEIDEFPHLPQIKYATIGCKCKSAQILRCFLKRNGESLQELFVDGVGIKEKMAFSEIFNFCPNLQWLGLYNCTLSANDAPVDAMQQLKRFSWCSSNEESSEQVAFSSILSAPLLENICIESSNIDFTDNATIIARIQKCEILRNLKEVRMIRRMDFIPEDEHSPFTELKNALESAISL